MSTASFHAMIDMQRGAGRLPVFNIPAGVSFVDRLAQTMLDWAQDDALSLSQYLVLLPSRRACRSLREAFLRLTDGAPLILPRMQPIGDVDDEGLDVLLSATLAEQPDAPADFLDIPPAITPLHRQILLARTIHAAKGGAGGIVPSYEQALSLADELGKLLDEVQTEHLSFDGLQDLVQEEKFAQHWQSTLTFLSILTEHWPDILAEREMIDPAARRNRLLEAQAQLWQQQPPQQKLVIAGVTGSIPAVRDLIKTAVALPDALMVLPGFDPLMSAEDWQHVTDEHPQFYLKLLLEHLGMPGSDVALWPGTAADTPTARLISETMRPAVTTDRWRGLSNRDIDENALAHIRKIDCKTAQDEALVIALAMRGALETPEKTAVLTTPDRNLSQRVLACLERWDIACDDSGGTPLSETQVGRFLLLVAAAAQEKDSPVALLACLRHKLTHAGLTQEEIDIWRNLLDRELRKHTLLNITTRLEELEDHGDLPLRGWQHVHDCLEHLRLLTGGTAHSLPAWFDAHLAAAEQLAATPEEAGAEILWRGEDGEAAARFLQEIAELSGDVPDLNDAQYVALLQNLMKNTVIRPRYNLHPRLAILGQMEARLYSADLVILGGLNEGVWPHDPGHDPWMSRPMRKQYGLPPAERRTGMEAHDFAQAVSAREVIITRAQNIEGTPTVPARWLLRMETVLNAVGLSWPVQRDIAGYAEILDRPEQTLPCARPAPSPPVADRPRKLSVTKVEAWMRDPYSIYARYVLGLEALDPLERDPGAAERGQIMHKILEDFVRDHCMTGVPDNAYDLLLEYGQREFENMRLPDDIYVFWWPRFERLADALVRHERKWQREAVPALVEAYGGRDFDAPAGVFRLSARADRIDTMRDGSGAAIIDYKTGTAPQIGDIVAGFSPQLPLEALLVAGTAFSGLPLSETAELLVWQVSGGHPPFQAKNYKADDIRRAIDNAAIGFPALVAAFDNPDTPYYAVPDLDKAPAYNDYAHLERLGEWGYVEKL